MRILGYFTRKLNNNVTPFVMSFMKEDIENGIRFWIEIDKLIPKFLIL